MTMPESFRDSTTSKIYVIASSLIVLGVGTAVLTGWFFDIPVLKSLMGWRS
jgi:hypothetical protein